MKKTFNINIVGFPFVIDEDAYTLLNDYLNTIEHAFRNVDGSAELINDIESRIAELLTECTEEGSSIITLSDVEQVIARVGKPEEFVDDETIVINNPEGNSETIEVETERTTPPPYIPHLPAPRKMLYRDPQNAMLGGVCSGLAWYTGWDVTWIRLILVVLTVCSYAVLALVYLILWIVVPEARTPLQRMQMMGEQPTMENIGKTVTDTFKEEQGTYVNPQPSNAPQSAGFLTQTFSLLAKIIIIIGLIIGIPILVGLVLGLLGCVFFLIMWASTHILGTGLPFEMEEWNTNPFVSKIIFWGVLCGIGWIITIALPLFHFVRKGLNYPSINKNSKRILFIVWGVGFLLAAVTTGMVISYAMQGDKYDYNRWRNEQKERIQESVTETIEMTDSTSISVDHIMEKIDGKVEELNKTAETISDKAEKISGEMEKVADSLTEASTTIRVP